MISPLVPALLWLLPLAALPVVFHLFLRLRRRTRVFPSLMFFLAADPHLHARRKVREWLVLALRCGALALLILALSRPQWRGGRGGGDVTQVWVVDNSASMSALDAEGRSRLQRAVAAAQALADDPDVKHGVVVPTVPDGAITLPEGLTAERAVWHAALNALRPTQAAGHPAAALARAVRELSGGAVGTAELHVFTDAQEHEWAASAASLTLPAHVRLTVHRVDGPSDRAGDVALEALVLPRRRPVTGRPQRFEVGLRNYAHVARDIVLNVAQPGASEPLRRALSLPPEGRQRVPMTIVPETGTELRLRVWLEGEAACAAAEGWAAAALSAGDPVWLLGPAAAFGLLPEALSPGGDGRLSGLLATEVEPARPLAGAPQVPALVAVAGAALADAGLSARLRTYVEQGGTLLVSPAADTGAFALPEWCGLAVAPERRSASGVAVRAQTPEAVVWEELRDADGRLRLPAVRAWHWVGLTCAAGGTPLLATEDGDTLLGTMNVGTGRVYASGIAWTAAWSDLPRRGAFLALVQGMALAGLPPVPVLRAGDPTAWSAELPTGEATVRIEALVGGAALRVEGPGATLAPPARAGIYRIASGTSAHTVALLGESDEADPTLVTGDALPMPATSPEQVTRYRSAADTVAATRRGRQGRSLFGALAAAAVLCVLAETWLAQRAVPMPAGGPRVR